MDRGRGLCRCCLGTVDLRPLETDLKQLYLSICPEQGDGELMAKVCLKCYSFLKEIDLFKKKCAKVSKILQNNTFENDEEVALVIKSMENDYIKDENTIDIMVFKTEIDVDNADLKTDSNVSGIQENFKLFNTEPFENNFDSLNTFDRDNDSSDESEKILSKRRNKRNNSIGADGDLDKLKLKIKLPNNLRGVKKKKSNLLKSSKIQSIDSIQKCIKDRKPRKRKHLTDKPFSCDECSYRCTRPSNLMYHQRTHTGERPHSCELCDYTCSSTSALRIHKKNKHSTNKPYSCDVCEYRSKTSTAMSNHKKLHYNIRDFKCELCPYKSIQLAQLENHKKMAHTGERPFACDQCPYRGSNFNNLKCHMRSHLPTKKYSCNYCAHSCHTKTSLQSHIMTHTGEKPYECNICDFKYFNLSSLKRHRRKQHNINSEKET